MSGHQFICLERKYRLRGAGSHSREHLCVGNKVSAPVVPASQTILSTSFLATLVPQCPLLGTVSPFILPPKPLGSSHPSLLAGLAKPGAASVPLRGCSLCLRCRSLLPGQLLSLFKSRIQFSPFLNPQLNTLGPPRWGQFPALLAERPPRPR